MNLLMMYWDTSILVLLVCVLILYVLVGILGKAQEARGFSSKMKSRCRVSSDRVWEVVKKIIPEPLVRRTQTAVSRCGLWMMLVVIVFGVVWSAHRLPEFLVAASINDLLLVSSSSETKKGESPALDIEYTLETVASKDWEIDPTAEVIAEIKSDDEAALYSRYQGLLFLFLCLLFLLGLIYIIYIRSGNGQGLLRGGSHMILKAALIGVSAMLVLAFFLLPMNFGKLIVSNEFPVVYIATTDEVIVKEGSTEGLYLMLVNNDKEIVLYDLENPIWESILVLRREQVKGIRVIGLERVFGGMRDGH